MDIFSFLSLFGGLAIFLFGMSIMGDSLEKQAGGKLKHLLEDLTSTPLKGVLLGAAVTAVIQSSSATTVMVVGFVNSGIMSLSKAVGIIMGANVGTTVTSWLLSLTGIQGDNVFIQLLKPSSFSPVLAVVGIILFMFVKNPKKKNVGAILLGFAVLMFGMEMMSDSVAPLADIPEFTGMLTLFSNPILGVITGALLTAIIQSSSASVGILQAISVTGSLNYATAVPIILGQNIGTCVTAILSSIGANKNAKRAAVVHLCFNVIGSLTFLIVYYIIRLTLQPAFIEQAANPAGVAVVHSIFNIFSTLLLLPFGKYLEMLAFVIVKDGGKKEKSQMLDERFLQTPSVALSQSRTLTGEMADLAEKDLFEAINLLENYTEAAAESVREMETKVDNYEDQLGTYLVKISSKSLSVDDSHEASKLLHIIGDFERISDHAVNILNTAKEVHEKHIKFTDDAQAELINLTAALKEIMGLAIQAFKENDLDKAIRIEPLEQVIDKIIYKMKNRHIERLKSGECTIETGFVFSDLLTNYERVSDHCSNIAVCLIQIDNDSFDTHEYLNNVKNYGENSFREKYDEYKRKYAI